MYPELKGKVALITGASKGIGRGIAEKFAGNGTGHRQNVAFLASDEAGYINGDHIKANGGSGF